MKKILLPLLLLIAGVVMGNVIFPYFAIGGEKLIPYFILLTAVTIIIEFFLLKFSLVNEFSSTVCFATITMNIISTVLMFLFSITIGIWGLFFTIPSMPGDRFVEFLYTQYPAMPYVTIITIALNTIIEFPIAGLFFRKSSVKQVWFGVLLANCLSFPISFVLSIYWPTIVRLLNF